MQLLPSTLEDPTFADYNSDGFIDAQQKLDNSLKLQI